MAEWNTIKQDFIKWLKAEEIDFNEDSKDFAPLKFKEKFKLFIEKEGENVNMDSFIKTNDKDNKLVTKMVSDYADDLDKDSKAFKALDTNDDGSISCDEKENFIEKAMKAGFDGNKDDFSFDDFTTAAEKLEAGDDEFLKDEDEEKVNGAAGAGGVGGAGGGGGNGGNVPPVDPLNQNPQDPADPANANALTVEQAMKLDSPMVNYTPTTVTAPKLSIKSVSQEGENITPSKAETGVQVGEYLKMPVADMVSSRENICSEMTAASEHFADFSASFAEANEFLTASKEVMAENEKQYEAIIENLAQSNENVKLANDQVTEYQNVIDATNSNINTLCAAKDATETSIVATDAQISSLQANLWKEVTTTDSKTGKQTTTLVLDTAVQAAIQAAEEQKQQLQQELETITQSLLENRETLLEANKQLQTSYDNLKSALEGVDFGSAEERENVMSMVHNKQEFSQASVDMNAAKAGMVAMDAYTVSLNSELNSIDKAIEIRLAKDSSLTEQERTTLGEEVNAVAPDKLDYSATEYTDPETGEPQQIEGLRKTNIDENATNNANKKRDWTSGKFEGFTCVTDAGTVTVTQENGKYIYRFEDGRSYTINPRKDTASYASAGGSELYSSAGAVGEEKTIVTRQSDGLIITTKMSGEGEIQNVDVSVLNQNSSKPTSIYGYSLTSDNKLSEANSYDPATGERFEYKNTYAENGLLTGYERTSKAKDGTTSATGETYTYDDQKRMTSATTSVDGKKVSETTYGYADTDKGYVETQIQTQYDENENKTQAIVTQTIMPGDGTSTVTITVNNYDGKKDPSSTREVVNTYDSEGKMLTSTREADGKSVLETEYGYNEEDDYQTSEDATQ
ncbi:MAG: hypothetical protein IJW73_04850, partial [Candidatus Gastranaerophilales bacterium]|nr:hypothetical protein [Candidatus Gastranaerophilales bacterium]